MVHSIKIRGMRLKRYIYLTCIGFTAFVFYASYFSPNLIADLILKNNAKVTKNGPQPSIPTVMAQKISPLAKAT